MATRPASNFLMSSCRLQGLAARFESQVEWLSFCAEPLPLINERTGQK